MATETGRLLHQVAVEVKYKRGAVFFDRCGSVMLGLEEMLGEPFVGSVPTMHFGLLQSAPEFLNVQYGPEGLNVAQQFAATIARVEQIAPRAWDLVAEAFAVEREVTRYGVRFWLMWPVASADEGEARLAESGLLPETPEWSHIFGEPSKRIFSTVHTEKDGRAVRAELRVGGVSLDGPPMAVEVERRAPKFAVLLDVDFFCALEVGRMTIRGPALKDFVRSSWERAREMANSVEQRWAGETK